MLEYHLELKFVELEYQKSGRSLISSETVFFCYKFCKIVIFGHFHLKTCQTYLLCMFQVISFKLSSHLLFFLYIE